MTVLWSSRGRWWGRGRGRGDGRGAGHTAVGGPAGDGHSASTGTSAFTQTNLVSDVHGLATLTDPLVSNPWGISLGPTTPLWVTNNNTDTATLYQGANGKQPISKVPLTVKLSPGPTGTVFNFRAASNPHDFVVTANGKSARRCSCSTRWPGTSSAGH